MWLVRMNIWLSLVGPKLEAGIKIREAEVINQVLVILGQMLQEIAIYFSIVCLIAGWISGLVAAAAAAAKSLQSCPTLCDPIDGSPPDSSSLGFSRQERWIGLPFPSPMHESEKWKWSCSVVSDSLQPHGLQPTRLLRPWEFPGKGAGVGCHCFSGMVAIVNRLVS